MDDTIEGDSEKINLNNRNLQRVEAVVNIAADFSVIEKKKSLFLSECDEALDPVKCAKAEKGSIKLHLSAPNQDVMETALSRIETDGLRLPSFQQHFTVVKNAARESSEAGFLSSDKIFIFSIAVVIFAIIAVASVFRMRSRRTKNNEVNQKKTKPSQENRTK